LGLATIIAAGQVRIAVNAGRCRRHRIGLVAIAVQALLAEMALAASDVERHQHLVADLEVGDLFAQFLDDARELMTEGHAHAAIGNHAVIKMQVGAADARPGHTNHGIPRMLDFRHRLFFDADPVRAPVIHGEHDAQLRGRNLRG
jgi:hypothetical protein